MYQVTPDEAKAHLDELIAAALKGERVVIAGDERHAIQLIPVPHMPRARQAGTARGLIVIAPDFDAPLADFDEYER
jgi:antitoxin (DNA-binding transcriptional repressor) of toxin-antitoxin stability system